VPFVQVDAAFEKPAKKLMARHPDKRVRVAKALAQLADDPWHPSLRSKRYVERAGVWQSYIEHHTPGAWRMWWMWDNASTDTIIVIEWGPHP
jgi:mRNA-degrading endonuclease YafQ of YafQ-DinJ toxin-antitoxin module